MKKFEEVSDNEASMFFLPSPIIYASHEFETSKVTNNIKIQKFHFLMYYKTQKFNLKIIK